MEEPRTVRAALPVLVGAGAMLSLAMGIRQCFGLFLQPLTRDPGLSVATFTLALSVQNLAWGPPQPFAGALAARLGFRPILLVGALASASPCRAPTRSNAPMSVPPPCSPPRCAGRHSW